LLDSLLESATRVDPRQRPTMQKFHEELSAWLQLSDGQSSPIDEKSIVNHIGALLLPQKRSYELLATRQKMVSQFLNQWSSTMLPIVSTLESIDSMEILSRISGNESVLNNVTMYRQHEWKSMLWRAGHSFTARIVYGPRVQIWSGIGAELVTLDLVNLVAGYFVTGQPHNESPILWQKEEMNIPVGSAQLELIAKEIMDEMIRGLTPSLETFVKYIEKLRTGSDS
jgi:hypothetical protein